MAGISAVSATASRWGLAIKRWFERFTYLERAASFPAATSHFPPLPYSELAFAANSTAWVTGGHTKLVRMPILFLLLWQRHKRFLRDNVFDPDQPRARRIRVKDEALVHVFAVQMCAVVVGDDGARWVVAACVMSKEKGIVDEDGIEWSIYEAATRIV